jgi:hypothetical protein
MTDIMSNFKLGGTASTSTMPISPTAANINEPYWKLVNTHEYFKVSVYTIDRIFRLYAKTLYFMMRVLPHSERQLVVGPQNQSRRVFWL